MPCTENLCGDTSKYLHLDVGDSSIFKAHLPTQGYFIRIHAVNILVFSACWSHFVGWAGEFSSFPSPSKAGSEVCSHTLKIISYKSHLMKIPKLNSKKLGPCFPVQLCCQYGTDSGFQITRCQEANNINPNRMFWAGANKLSLVLWTIQKPHKLH